MIGATVIASTPLQPVGRVDYKGEDWTAVLDDPSTSVDPGTEVRIVAVEGLLVHVQPVVDKLSEFGPYIHRGVIKEEFNGSHCGTYHRSTRSNNNTDARILGYTSSAAIRARGDFCPGKINRCQRDLEYSWYHHLSHA